jgi:hypothetical protein
MNETYSCVEMLWKVSDFLGQKEDQTEYQQIWESIFNKFYVSCSHSNSQIRHSSLKIYGSLLSDYGPKFSKELWLVSFRDLFFTLFDEVFEVFLNLTINQKNGTDIEVPEFVQKIKT